MEEWGWRREEKPTELAAICKCTLTISIANKLTIHRSEAGAHIGNAIKDIICMIMCAIRSTNRSPPTPQNNIFFILFCNLSLVI